MADPTQQREESKLEGLLNDELCDCAVPVLEGAGQHSAGCRTVRTDTRKLAAIVLSSGLVVPASRAEQAEAEVERLKAEFHELALFTDEHGEWIRWKTAGTLAGVIHNVARSALSGGEERDG